MTNLSCCTFQVGMTGQQRQFVAPKVFSYDPELERFYALLEMEDGNFIRLWLPESDLAAVKASHSTTTTPPLRSTEAQSIKMR